MRGRPKSELVLTEDEHEQLTALTLRRKTAQALALRARIVLACAEGVDNKLVASREPDSSSIGWTDCLMLLDPVRRARSTTRVWTP